MTPDDTNPQYEPTQAARSYNTNPPQYEVTEPNPYIGHNPYMDIPMLPPPPPPTKKHNGWMITSAVLFAVLLVGATALIVRAITPGRTQDNPPQVAISPTPLPTLTPTAIPTPTATPTQGPIIGNSKAPYSAALIVSYFRDQGLLLNGTAHVDSSWSCCTYYPEGGALYWTDPYTGITMDLATFASIDEAQIDGKQLVNKGYNGYTNNYCLLTYSGSPSDIQSYLSIMGENCTY